jgi:hypothetical protein
MLPHSVKRGRAEGEHRVAFLPVERSRRREFAMDPGLRRPFRADSSRVILSTGSAALHPWPGARAPSGRHVRNPPGRQASPSEVSRIHSDARKKSSLTGVRTPCNRTRGRWCPAAWGGRKNRESGEMPERPRRCDRERKPHRAIGRTVGREGAASRIGVLLMQAAGARESEDLPARPKPRLPSWVRFAGMSRSATFPRRSNR